MISPIAAFAGVAYHPLGLGFGTADYDATVETRAVAKQGMHRHVILEGAPQVLIPYALFAQVTQDEFFWRQGITIV